MNSLYESLTSQTEALRNKRENLAARINHKKRGGFILNEIRYETAQAYLTAVETKQEKAKIRNDNLLKNANKLWLDAEKLNFEASHISPELQEFINNYNNHLANEFPKWASRKQEILSKTTANINIPVPVQATSSKPENNNFNSIIKPEVLSTPQAQPRKVSNLNSLQAPIEHNRRVSTTHPDYVPGSLENILQIRPGTPSLSMQKLLQPASLKSIHTAHQNVLSYLSQTNNDSAGTISNNSASNVLETEMKAYEKSVSGNALALESDIATRVIQHENVKVQESINVSSKDQVTVIKSPTGPAEIKEETKWDRDTQPTILSTEKPNAEIPVTKPVVAAQQDGKAQDTPNVKQVKPKKKAKPKSPKPANKSAVQIAAPKAKNWAEVDDFTDDTVGHSSYTALSKQKPEQIAPMTPAGPAFSNKLSSLSFMKDPEDDDF